MFPAGTNLNVVSSLSEEDLARHAADADILLVIHRKVDAHILSILPHVRFIQRIGVGYDNLDLEALQAAGVVAAYTPGANAVAVAEHTILLMLALLKRFPAAEFGYTPGRLAHNGAIPGRNGRSGQFNGWPRRLWQHRTSCSPATCAFRVASVIHGSPCRRFQQPNSSSAYAMSRSMTCWLLPRSSACMSHSQKLRGD